MGSCFSQQAHSTSPTSPATYATAAATSALNAVQSYLDPSSTAPPPDPNVKQVINNAYITKVPDGDTFTCTAQGTNHRVRVMGVDAPETRQNHGKESGDLARSLLLNRSVTLHVHTTDRYQRMVADVILPSGENFAERMLREGAVWHYTDYDKRERYAALEREAREKKVGLWRYARPQPPWEYRRRMRQR